MTTSSRARARVAASAVLLGLLPALVACRSADIPAPAAGEGATSQSPEVAVKPGTAPSTPAPNANAKPVLSGGGFASAVPGSDAPDRKDDPGPQFALTEGLDIEEVERLVVAVERIAKQLSDEEPQATGGSVAAAVGTFSYRYFADGSLQPDPEWVAANIATEEVPILGTVTGHKALFPQLRSALAEVASRGLAGEINVTEFGGCYVPRFIGHDPGKGLSLHSWGIAVDLNVPGNLRGTVGEIDRDVVTIFKNWGFAWGGDWNYTDPMHFELAKLAKR